MNTQTPKIKLNSGHVEQAIRRHINPFQQTIIPECAVRCDLGLKTGFDGAYTYQDYHEYKADFLTISVSGYATEIEVKVSKADWKSDIKKQKWEALPGYISRFIYAVPESLGIPDFVPDFAGIWHIVVAKDGCMRIKVVRAPKRLGKEKVPEPIVIKWMSVFYSRYWHQRISASKKLPSLAK